jgi:hypothetical protein
MKRRSGSRVAVAVVLGGLALLVGAVMVWDADRAPQDRNVPGASTGPGKTSLTPDG